MTHPLHLARCHPTAGDRAALAHLVGRLRDCDADDEPTRAAGDADRARPLPSLAWLDARHPTL